MSSLSCDRVTTGLSFTFTWGEPLSSMIHPSIDRWSVLFSLIINRTRRLESRPSTRPILHLFSLSWWSCESFWTTGIIESIGTNIDDLSKWSSLNLTRLLFSCYLWFCSHLIWFTLSLCFRIEKSESEPELQLLIIDYWWIIDKPPVSPERRLQTSCFVRINHRKQREAENPLIRETGRRKWSISLIRKRSI